MDAGDVTDHAAEVRRLLERVDELVKYASNRPDPVSAYEAARVVLERADREVAAIAEPGLRDGLIVQIGRRADDLDLLLHRAGDRDGPDGASPTEPGPARAPDDLPQPGPETLEAASRSGARRLPPNQRLVTSWPVLHTGRVPRVDLDAWRFTVRGLIRDRRVRWTWEEFRDLPTTRTTSDFHCVTGWSRLDNRWEGVAFARVAEAVGVLPGATHAVIYGANAYSANCDLATLLRDDVLFAWSHDGAPLAPDHGGPLRLVLPSRYAWKSVKWVEGVQFLDRDVAGYWETRGYHNVADPFLEQRYA